MKWLSSSTEKNRAVIFVEVLIWGVCKLRPGFTTILWLKMLQWAQKFQKLYMYRFNKDENNYKLFSNNYKLFSNVCYNSSSCGQLNISWPSIAYTSYLSIILKQAYKQCTCLHASQFNTAIYPPHYINHSINYWKTLHSVSVKFHSLHTCTHTQAAKHTLMHTITSKRHTENYKSIPHGSRERNRTKKADKGKPRM